MSVTASDNALTTVADVKYVWGRNQDDTTYDDRIQTLINIISGRIEALCNRKFKLATYTDEVYDVPRGKYLFLKQYPVIGTPVVKLNDEIIDSSYYKVYNDEGYLYSDNGWDYVDDRHREYKVTYQAGYSTIPAGLSEICIEWVIMLLEGRMKDAKVDHSDIVYNPQAFVDGLAPFKRIEF